MPHTEEQWADARERMVVQQLQRRGIADARVLQAMRAVPRHIFFPARDRAHAYDDSPWPIGHGQTISQPFIVARMTELAEVRPGSRVLEVGTGCGYQAAILAACGAHVFSIERVADLAEHARARLSQLGCNVTVRTGDGYLGWPEEAPFDAIVVTAAPETLPPALVDQLAVSGRLVIPVGPAESQELRTYVRRGHGQIEMRAEFPVRFVPLLDGVV